VPMPSACGRRASSPRLIEPVRSSSRIRVRESGLEEAPRRRRGRAARRDRRGRSGRAARARASRNPPPCGGLRVAARVGRRSPRRWPPGARGDASLPDGGGAGGVASGVARRSLAAGGLFRAARPISSRSLAWWGIRTPVSCQRYMLVVRGPGRRRSRSRHRTGGESTSGRGRGDPKGPRRAASHRCPTTPCSRGDSNPHHTDTRPFGKRASLQNPRGPCPVHPQPLPLPTPGTRVRSLARRRLSR